MKNFGIILDALIENEGMFFEDFDEEMVYEFYMEHGFMPINTYKAWDKLGYQVQKGEKKRMDLYLWVHKGKNQEIIDNDADGDSENDKKKNPFYKKKSYMFDFSQVKPKDAEKLPDIPVYTGDIEVIDEIEEGTDLESVPENEVQDVVNDENNKMQFNYKPIEKKKEVIDEDLPRTCRTALNKYVKNLMSEKTNASPITRQINFDEKHGTFILDGFTAIYMNFDKYIVPMPKSEETMNHGFIPEYAEKSWDVLSIKDLKDAFKGYKQTTGAKMGYFKIRNTILDAKRLIDTVSIIDNKAFVIEYTDNAREICLLIGSYGKAIICPMNPNGIDESMIIGSIE